MTKLDPITAELIRNSMQAIVDEMALTLVRTAYSANLKSAMDLSSAMCDPHGRLIAQGLTLPLHLGSIPDAIEALLNRFGGDFRPGDAFVLNDPYEGGTHLPDFFVFQPVFDAETLIAFAVTVAHHTDVGGRVAGGNGWDSTEIYQEGLRIPVVRLCTDGQINADFLHLLSANVRIPTKVLGDLRAQLAACHIGERGLLDLLARYGRELLEVAFEDLVSYTERLARATIEQLPDGRYEFADYLDDDGIDPQPILIQVAVNVRGSELEVDFSGSSPQVKGAINCVLSFTKSSVYACVRCLLPATLPNNEGYMRAIKVIAPPGTIVNPLPPAPVAARGLTGYRIANAVMGALAQVAPQSVPACESGGDTGISLGGYDSQRRAFVFLEFLVCSWGGRPFADGIDGVASMVVNFSNYPAEVIEREYPLRIEEYGFLADSGGPGQFRGGLALVRRYRFLEESGTFQIRSDRSRFAAYGLAGGGPGRLSRNVLNPGPHQRLLPPKTTLHVTRGDELLHELAGAGGWGDPFARDPRAVLADVRNEKVTVGHARSAYGVVLDASATTVDEMETMRLREHRRAERTPSGSGQRRARMGIIGTGWWATYAHLPSLISYPTADVVAVADPSPERLAHAAEHFGIDARYGDYRAMLDRGDLDGVVVATPHTTHYDIASEVLSRGIPLMLEKPMVLRARDARDLVNLAEQQQIPFVIGYPYHFVEQHARLRARIAEGALGQIQLTHALFASMVLEYYRANPHAYADVFKWAVTGPQPTTYSEPSVSGGGQAQLQVTHSAALLLWLTNLQPREVAAFLEKFDLQVDLCDAISVQFDNGAIGTLASTGAVPATQRAHQQLELRVYGSGGYALLDPMAGTCSIYYNDGSVEQLEEVVADRRYPQHAPARHLVDLILDDDHSLVNMSPGEVGARTVELLEAAYRSAAERRVVRIDELD